MLLLTGYPTKMGWHRMIPKRETRKLPLLSAYPFGALHGLEREVNAIREMVIDWQPRTSSVRRGYIVELFEKHGIFEEFRTQHWAWGETPGGARELRLYRRLKDEHDKRGGGPEPSRRTTR